MRRLARRGQKIVKSCACGRAYAKKEWDALPLVGTQEDAVEVGELRDCPCGSTLSLGRVRVRVLYEVEATEGGWLVFRKAGSAEAIALGAGKRATVFRTRKAANSAIDPQRVADRAAASRLNVDLVVDVANDHAKGEE